MYNSIFYDFIKNQPKKTFFLSSSQLLVCLMFFAFSNFLVAQQTVVVPNSFETQTGNYTWNIFSNKNQTCQLLIDQSQLTDLVGQNLEGISFRLAATDNPSGATSVPWPSSQTTYGNFDIYLSQSVPIANKSTTFASNIVGAQLQVRSGSLVIEENSYTNGSPAPFGPTITFDTPYFYSGGNLLLEIRHTTSDNSSANGPMNGIHNSHAEYNTNISCVINISTANGYTATSGLMDYAALVVRFSATTSSPPCIVNIPDANFKNYLVNNLDINTNGDDEIQCDEASAFSGMINCSSMSISDLTGIEAFTSLTELRCQDNDLTTLNVSNNLNLNILRCYTNLLTSLDVSNNTNLTRLYCQNNQLQTLDVSQNDLQYLWCNTNVLTSLNVSGNANLERLLCFDNQLTSLDLSTNANLNRLSCYNNQLTSLDVSNNPVLNRFWCNNNDLTILKVKNGNNINFITFEAQDNANLTCIEVDDPVYCGLNWTNIDSGTTFSQDCGYSIPCVVNIPNSNFKTALLNHNPVIDLDGDGEIQCSEAEAFTSNLNLYSKNISNLTGIEAFTNITYLDCGSNQISNIDLSSNTNLQNVYLNDNQLTSIDLSNNVNLKYFVIDNNQLTSIDFSNNPELLYLQIKNNSLTSLDLSNNIKLTNVECENNSITSLDLTANIYLKSLFCQNNELTTLSNNNGLQTLRCQNNQLTNLNVSNFPQLESLFCQDNNLTVLDINNTMYLSDLRCQNNPITELNTTNSWDLEELYCDNTLISSLNMSNNSKLKLLSASNCSLLTTLDLSNNGNLVAFDGAGSNLMSLNVKNGNNTNVWYFDATNNPNLVCIEVDNILYSNPNWTNIDSQSCFSENCVTPTFTEIGTICNGDTFVLDEDSQNGISGVWSPAIDNTQTQTYIFTPNTCANKTTMTVVVSDIISTPTGDESQTFTQGQTIADLVVNGDNLVFYNSTYSETFSLTDELVDSQTYYVVSQIGNCMSDPLIITVTMVVSRSEFDIYGFSYHPNPVNDVLYFSSNSKIEKVVISNMLGQEVKTNLSSDKTSMDVSNLPSGNYFVKVTIEGVSKIIKIIKN